MTTNDQRLGYRRILVATDFSPHSEAALRQAVWIAQQYRSHLVLAHVVADLRRAVSRTSYRSRIEFLEGSEEHFQRELRRESDEKLKQAIRGLGKTGLDITYETLLGEPYVELIHSVQQEQYDLVVAGTRGHTAWKRLFVGSTARRLVRKCPCTVWIVKGQEAKPPTAMLAAVDMSEASRRALEHAASLARQSEAQLHVLHVIESQGIPQNVLGQTVSGSDQITFQDWLGRQADNELKESCRPFVEKGVSIHYHVEWGSPGHEIINLAHQLNVQLIILGTVGRSGVDGLLLGNTAESVLMHCDCDVLTVKPAGYVSPIAPPTWPLHPGPENGPS